MTDTEYFTLQLQGWQSVKPVMKADSSSSYKGEWEVISDDLQQNVTVLCSRLVKVTSPQVYLLDQWLQSSMPTATMHCLLTATAPKQFDFYMFKQRLSAPHSLNIISEDFSCWQE